MQRILLSFALFLVCTTVFAQRPDKASRGADHRPSTAGNSAASGQSSKQTQTFGGTKTTDQDSGSRQRGMNLTREHSDLNQGSSSAESRPNQSFSRGRSLDSHKPKVNETRLTGKQHALQTQLASIEKMRVKAEETGNQEMLARADELEKRVREKYVGVTLPNEQPLADDVVEGEQRAKSQRGKTKHMNAGTNDNRAFGQSVAEQARADGRTLGQSTSEQARSQGREFGKSNANKTRLIPPLATPNTEPKDDDEYEPTPEDDGDGENQ